MSKIIDEINEGIEADLEKKIESNNRRKIIYDEIRKKRSERKFKRWKKIQIVKKCMISKKRDEKA